MIEVFIPAPLRKLTDGRASVSVTSAETVGEALSLVNQQYPGIADRLVTEGVLRAGTQVTVDGSIAAKGLRHPLTDNSEVHFLPALGGG